MVKLICCQSLKPSFCRSWTHIFWSGCLRKVATTYASVSTVASPNLSTEETDLTSMISQIIHFDAGRYTSDYVVISARCSLWVLEKHNPSHADFEFDASSFFSIAIFLGITSGEAYRITEATRGWLWNVLAWST
jgi:hypothetical protein